MATQANAKCTWVKPNPKTYQPAPFAMPVKTWRKALATRTAIDPRSRARTGLPSSGRSKRRG